MTDKISKELLEEYLSDYRHFVFCDELKKAEALLKIIEKLELLPPKETK